MTTEEHQAHLARVIQEVEECRIKGEVYFDFIYAFFGLLEFTHSWNEYGLDYKTVERMWMEEQESKRQAIMDDIKNFWSKSAAEE